MSATSRSAIPTSAERLSGAVYDAVIAPVEALGLATQRRQLVSAARGRVLEIGGGTGLTLRHYTAATSVTVCEPDPGLRARLVNRTARTRVPVTVLDGGVPGLMEPTGSGPRLKPGSFDTIVCALVLCTVADVEGALAEMRELLRPDGSLLFLEHIVATGRRLAFVQRALTPLWSHVAGGCQLDRDTIGALRAANFVVTDCERLAPAGRLTAGVVVRGRAIPRLAP